MTSPQVPGQPEQLREEIEQTRAELGGTVEALAAKTDVKTRARRALSDTTERTRVRLDAAKLRVTEASRHPAVRCPARSS